MKQILITGVNSYIGNSFKQWVEQWPNDYKVDTISVRGDEWRTYDFQGYNAVIHVAGIVHQKETTENAELYYVVNRDLTYEISMVAKSQGVRQFIYISTMSIYGIEEGVIDKNTKPNPSSNYGKSKLQAEVMINNLADAYYKVAIIRPPMVYGKGCKGNYKILSKFAKKFLIFPDIQNERSMIYIDNLSEYIRYIIDHESGGLYLPQNKEYVSTKELVKIISELQGRKVIFTKIFNPLIRMMNFKLLKKIFGSLKYTRDNEVEIRQCSLVDSIANTESV